MITSANQLLYSLSAIRRILGLSSERVTYSEWDKVVWVHVAGQSPTMIPKLVFKQHFALWRRAQGKALSVTQNVFNPKFFTIRNESKDSRHELTAELSGVYCSCEDFANQRKYLGTGCCKHGYAVLAHLGYPSLSEYLAAKRGD